MLLSFARLLTLNCLQFRPSAVLDASRLDIEIVASLRKRLLTGALQHKTREKLTPPAEQLPASDEPLSASDLHEENPRVYGACHMICPEPAFRQPSYDALLQYEVSEDLGSQIPHCATVTLPSHRALGAGVWPDCTRCTRLQACDKASGPHKVPPAGCTNEALQGCAVL